jgi:hypothetical protein
MMSPRAFSADGERASGQNCSILGKVIGNVSENVPWSVRQMPEAGVMVS